MLTPVTYRNAAIKAKAAIEEEKSGEQTGVLTRFATLNKALMKYLRFKNVCTIAGASGSAKSFLLTELRDDFRSTKEISIPFQTNDKNLIKHIHEKAALIYTGKELVFPAINKESKNKVCILHFSFEMSPDRELTRSACDYTGFNYSYINSSHAKKLSNGNYEYNILTNEEQRFTNAVFDYLALTNNVLFFPLSATIIDIYRTVEAAYNKYIKDNPDPTKLIVMLDHTLLTKKGKEKSDLELINSLSQLFIDLREIFGALVIPLNQFNNEIEDDRRRSKPELHYPLKSDIYCGGQLYQASDFVFTMFMPSKLGIGKYGPRQVSTKNIIHLGCIKSRYSTDGQLWLWNDLVNGHLLPAYPQYSNTGKFHKWVVGSTLNNKKYKISGKD